MKIGEVWVNKQFPSMEVTIDDIGKYQKRDHVVIFKPRRPGALETSSLDKKDFLRFYEEKK